jgi:hypothetical protein
MTHDDILELFRQHATTLGAEAQAPMLNSIIIELAQLLAESRGKLTKETFDTLVHIGGVLYRAGDGQFQARSDVDAIMKHSLKT